MKKIPTTQMETHSTGIAPDTNPVPCMVPATALGIGTLLMKTKMFRLFIVLCGVFAAATAFGQTVYTWTGAANGTNLSTTNNWITNGVPATTLPNGNNGLGDGFQDSAQWNGLTTSNLLLIYNTTWPNTGFGSVGVNLVMTASQVNDVQITTSLATSAGVGINHVTNNSPSAAFTMGDTSANNWLCFGRPAGAIHFYINNSTAPATINPSVKFQAGGGAGYTYQFGGTGNWIINSFLMPDNNAFSASPITVDGPGTVTWFGGKSGGYNPNSALGAVTVNGGILVIKTNTLFTGTANQAIVNNATFIYDAAAAQSLNGAISGTGLLIVTNGTVTLGGQSTYSGTTLLEAGTLIVNSTENVGVSGPLGLGGTISFSGGTLAWSVNNVFDYSSRFDTAAGQPYSLDTAGQNVTLATGLTSSGATLVKAGNGTLTLSGANTYSGLTTVSVGKLVIQGTKTGTGNITVADGAALGVTTTGTQVTPATLTVGTSSSATLEFNSVSSTITAPLAPTAVSAGGTITINVNSGTLAPANSYPLLAWTSGSAPAVSLGILNGFIGNLTTNGNSIVLNITATAYLWTGLSNDSWDLSTAGNWQQNGGPVVFVNGGPALFDDTSATNNVTINALVQPTTVTVNNSVTNYTITSSGGNNLGGSASLTKSGSGSLTLSGGANTYTGASTLSAGTVSVGALANGGAASDIGSSGSAAASLVLNGGVLQYTGVGASSDRLFTLGTSGGTIDASGTGDLNLSNGGSLGYSGNGARTLTLTGSGPSNTLAAVLANNGGATSLAKNGTGTWVVTANSTHTGPTTINNGVLQIGNGGGTGSPSSGAITDNGTLAFNRTGSLTVSGAVGGTGSVTKDGSGTVILSANNTYAGGTTITAGTLQIGNGGGTGALGANGAIANEGTFIFNSTAQPPDIFGIISGTGNLIKRGTGTLRIFGNNTYTGTTAVEAGTLQICTGNTGANASPQIAISTNATLSMVRQDNAIFIYAGNIIGQGRLLKDINNVQAGDVTLTGTNTQTGGTYIAGGGIILGDAGTTPFGGSIVGNVIFTNSTVDNNVARSLTFNRAEDYTFSGHIFSTNTGAAGTRGSVVHNGLGITTLTGTNSYPDGTTINAGTLRINGTNSGGGTVTVNVGGTLGGTGRIVGNVNVTAGGILAPGASVGTLTIVSNLTIVGDLTIEVNKSLAQSNDVAVVGGTLNNTGVGTLTVVNLGPAIQIGDKFTLFNQPVVGGSALTVTGGGAPGWINNLAVDGSIVASGPELSFVNSGPSLDFSWTASGYKLQAQTNSLAVGITGTWADYPGGGSSPVSVPIDAAQPTVFFRLAPTP